MNDARASYRPSSSIWSTSIAPGSSTTTGSAASRRSCSRAQPARRHFVAVFPPPYRDPVRGPGRARPRTRCSERLSRFSDRAGSRGGGRPALDPCGPGAVARRVAAGHSRMAAAVVVWRRCAFEPALRPVAVRPGASRVSARQRRLAGQRPGLPLGRHGPEARPRHAAGKVLQAGAGAGRDRVRPGRRASSCRARPASSSFRRPRPGSSTAR